MENFYARTNILITGGTGFLGKSLIDKLLTSCKDVESVYLLVRPKKGKTEQERVEQIFEGTVFNCEEYQHKIHVIAGNCMLPNLGIDEADIALLQRKINIVFHMAATVRFDESLNAAAQMNVRATRDLLEMCNNMANLRCFMHVSTIFSQCSHPRVEERFYKPPMGVEGFLNLTKWVPEETLNQVVPAMLDERPNTYTYTKAMAESVVQSYGRVGKVAVFRPSIVISSSQEPEAGWIDNMYGSTGAVAGYLTGFMRTMSTDPMKKACLVPVDLCVNALLACTWDATTRYEAGEIVDDPPVYNLSSTSGNSLTWDRFNRMVQQYGKLYPTLKSLWHPGVTMNPTPAIHWLYVLFLHYLPAVLVDGATWMVGKTPILLNQYRKTNQYISLLRYFSTRDFDFQLDNMNKIWNVMTPHDRQLFNFNMDLLDWEKFMKDYVRGVRVNLLKDPIDTLPAALERLKMQYWMHQSLKMVMFLLLISLVGWLIRMIC